MIKTLGPDEAIYRAQAMAVRGGGIRALRDLADEYLEEPTLAAYPSPLRWLWAAVGALTLPFGETATQAACATLMVLPVLLVTHSWPAVVLAAASPLVLSRMRWRLQDVPVAFLTVTAVGCGFHHWPIATAAVLAVLLCFKESGVLAVPAIAGAWLLSGGSLPTLAAAIFGGLSAWTLSLFAIFGRRVPAMFRAATNGHATTYAKDHQGGAPHRLVADLFLASPIPVMLAVIAAPHSLPIAAASVAIVATHVLAPIRNVRFIIAADVLLRVVAAGALPMPWLWLPIAIAIDVAVMLRIARVYDPVTSALTEAFRMSPAAKP